MDHQLAAATGRALLAKIRGDVLSPRQERLLAQEPARGVDLDSGTRVALPTARGLALSEGRLAPAATPEDRAESRSALPVEGRSHTLLRLGRGEDAEVQIRLRSFVGSSPFLDIRRFERGADRVLSPTKQGVTIRAREVGRLMSALIGVAARLGADSEEPAETRYSEVG